MTLLSFSHKTAHKLPSKFGITTLTKEYLASGAGQRLDGTGLYYYNARYYDPTIGLFISADTIIPNPANPQSFNRYSYCLNNPLKYVDPSGQEVEIGGVTNEELEKMDYLQLVQTAQNMSKEDEEIIDAWIQLYGVAPELCEKLNNLKETITIQWAKGIQDWLRYESNYDMTGGRILINSAIRDFHPNSKTLAWNLSHEAVHAAIRLGADIPDREKFAANEAFAYGFMYLVGQKLGLYSDSLEQFKDINPWLPSNELNISLQGAANRLAELSDTYTKGWLFWRGPLDVWAKSDSNGEKCLTVAKAIWIK